MARAMGYILTLLRSFRPERYMFSRVVLRIGQLNDLYVGGFVPAKPERQSPPEILTQENAPLRRQSGPSLDVAGPP
jgi:hypothetical protein